MTEHEGVFLIVGTLLVVIGVTTRVPLVTALGVGLLIGTAFGWVFIRPRP